MCRRLSRNQMQELETEINKRICHAIVDIQKNVLLLTRKKVNDTEFLSVFIATIVNKTLTACLLRMTRDVNKSELMKNYKRRVVITNSIRPYNPVNTQENCKKIKLQKIITKGK